MMIWDGLFTLCLVALVVYALAKRLASTDVVLMGAPTVLIFAENQLSNGHG